MENNNDQVQEKVTFTVLPQLPNATAALVLGILSIVFCWCWGVVGIILGIVGLVMANKAVALYESAPGTYSEPSYKNVKAGKICSIIGICLGALYLIICVIYLFAVGTMIGGMMPWSDILNGM